MSCPDERRIALELDGELTTNESRELRDHLSSCTQCATVARRLERLTGAIAQAYPVQPAPDFADEVLRRTQAPSPPRGRLALAGLALAVPLAAMVALTMKGRVESPPQIAGLTPRGGLKAPDQQRLVGFEVRSAGVLLNAQAVIAPERGFTFRIFNRTQTAIDLALFGVDSRGEIHWFYPAWLDSKSNPRTMLLSPQPAVVDLQEAVAPERVPAGRFTIYALFCEQPSDVRSIEALLENGGASALAASLPRAIFKQLELKVQR